MAKIISLNEFVARKEQEKEREFEEEFARMEKRIKEVIDANPPKPPEPVWLWSEQEAESYLKASNLDIAVMKLMDAVVLLDSCGKKEESDIINKIAGKLLGVEDF
tara:strand:+ start:557 stop:871 length:315 start_codon:yes stop_codon:yes gene_type:complete